MPLLRGDFLSTLRKQIVGKVQLYALKVLADRSAVLDADGNEQVTELEVVDGKLRSQPESRYQDLGLVVEGLNMAAGAVVYGNWIDNVEWVRNITAFAQSDQQYDAHIYRRDTSLISDWGSGFSMAQPATGVSWRTHQLASSFSGSANAFLGYGCRFGMKNSAAVANTFARMRIQLGGI